MPRATTHTATTYMPTTAAYYEGHVEEMRPGMHALATVDNPRYPMGTPTSTLQASAMQAFPGISSPTDPRAAPPVGLRTSLLDPKTYAMAEHIGLNKRAILENTLTAAEYDTGRDNLDHLILIRLYNQLMGDQMRCCLLYTSPSPRD